MTLSHAGARHRFVTLLSATLLAGAALLALAAPAAAQAPPRDDIVGMAPPEDVQFGARAIALAPAQRLAIYQSVTQTDKNHAAPLGFRAAIGARVPAGIELKALSPTLADLVPSARDLSIGMVEKQVILVDPSTREIVAVVTPEPTIVVH